MTSSENSSSTARFYRDFSIEHTPDTESPPSTTATAFHDGDHADSGATATDATHGLSQTAAPPGATVYSPGSAVSSALNPRSCVTCRKRKVRCDKHMPCSNCRRAQISCVFPAPGRAPRRPRQKEAISGSKQPSSEREVELMKRLRKLEGIVEELSGQVESEGVRHGSSAGQSPEAVTDGDTRVPGRAGSTASGGSRGQGSPAASGHNVGGPARTDSVTTSSSHSGQIRPQNGFKPPERTMSSDVNKNFGRLILNDKGRSRYVSSEIWAKINDEVSSLWSPVHMSRHHDVRSN
jgi:hypothetical protein